MRPLHELAIGARFQLKYGEGTGKQYELLAIGPVVCRIRPLDLRKVTLPDRRVEWLPRDAFDIPRNAIVEEITVSAAR